MNRYIYYNSNGIANESDRSSDKEPSKLWIDISDPSPDDLQSITREYGLDEDSVRLIGQRTKRPQIRILDNHIFTILLNIRFRTIKQLLIEVSIFMLAQTG